LFLYVHIIMAIYRIAIGSPREASNPAAIRAAFAEFFSMIIFVFAGQGSGMAYSEQSIMHFLTLLFSLHSFISVKIVSVQLLSKWISYKVFRSTKISLNKTKSVLKKN
jgi:hypothetical protein